MDSRDFLQIVTVDNVTLAAALIAVVVGVWQLVLGYVVEGRNERRRKETITPRVELEYIPYLPLHTHLDHPLRGMESHGGENPLCKTALELHVVNVGQCPVSVNYARVIAGDGYLGYEFPLRTADPSVSRLVQPLGGRLGLYLPVDTRVARTIYDSDRRWRFEVCIGRDTVLTLPFSLQHRSDVSELASGLPGYPSFAD